MTTAVTSSAPSYVLETANRRMINAEHAALKANIIKDLTELKEEIDSYGMDDDLTKEILNWHSKFLISLNLKNVVPQKVHDSFIDLLKEILIDPLSLDCLDEEAELGTDGRTYGKISLNRYWNSPIEEIYKKRSPLEPKNEKPFSTTPHLAVRCMLNWLKRNHALPESAETKRPTVVRHVERNTESTSLVTASQSERIEKLRARLAARQRNQQQINPNAEKPKREIKREERREHVNQFLTNLEAQVTRDVKEDIDQNVHQRVQEAAQRQLQQANDLERVNRERNQMLDRMMDELEEGIVALDRENDELARIVESVDVLVDEAKKDDARLRMTINQAKQEHKKKKKSWIKDVLVAAAVVGLCIVAAWAAAGVLSAAGAASTTATALPQSGGAMLKLTVVW